MTFDPSDLANNLRADAPAPAQEPTFFETLAVAATQSTPTAGAALFLGIGRTKVIAATAGTALLLSGAVYAGGLMGGGPEQHSSSVVAPAHSSAKADRSATGVSSTKGAGSASHPARHHAAAHHQVKHQTSAKGGSDPSTGPAPATGTTPTGDECQHHGDPGTWWGHWHGWGHDHHGDQDGDGHGDHNGDGWHHGGGGSGRGGGGWGSGGFGSRQ